ncbi:MAG: alpha/beta hydrolase [Microthrixaceae bacterium]
MTTPLVPHRTGTTRLSDGRSIGWAVFGPADGDPVFWFHGTPGARHQLPHDAAELATERGLRIITIERPGTGSSTSHHYDRVVDFVDDFLQVADDLGVHEFAVVGLSGGGPFVLAVAHELPRRTIVGVVLGGIGPTRGIDSIVSHTMLLVPAAPVLRFLRVPLAKGLSSLVHLATPLADQAVDLFFNLMPGDRGHFSERPLDRRQFTADLIDANHRSGIGAVVDDLILFGRYWGFELRRIKVPIVFYGGNSDVIVPYLHAERQSERVTDARLRTYEGRGHFAGYTTPAHVLDDIREQWPSTPAAPSKAAKRPTAGPRTHNGTKSPKSTPRARTTKSRGDRTVDA